jgi:hypothetical protein
LVIGNGSYENSVSKSIKASFLPETCHSDNARLLDAVLRGMVTGKFFSLHGLQMYIAIGKFRTFGV